MDHKQPKLKQIPTTGYVKAAGDRYVGRIIRENARAINDFIYGINSARNQTSEVGLMLLEHALLKVCERLEFDRELKLANPHLDVQGAGMDFKRMTEKA